MLKPAWRAALNVNALNVEPVAVYALSCTTAVEWLELFRLRANVLTGERFVQ